MECGARIFLWNANVRGGWNVVSRNFFLCVECVVWVVLALGNNWCKILAMANVGAPDIVLSRGPSNLDCAENAPEVGDASSGSSRAVRRRETSFNYEKPLPFIVGTARSRSSIPTRC